MAIVGFVGAGSMGEPMIERLVGAGHDVRVFVRRAEVRDRLAARGVRVTDSIASAAQQAEIFLVCLYSDSQLSELAPAALSSMPSGSVFASHVTGRPETVAALDDRGARLGVSIVDAPVSGDIADIRDGRLTVLLGGEPGAVDRTEAVVRAYADPILRTGELGTALAIKLVNNILFAANCQLVDAALGLSRQLNIPVQSFLDAAQHMSGRSGAADSVLLLGGVENFSRTALPYLVKDVAAGQLAGLRGEANLLFDVIDRGGLAITPRPRVEPAAN